MAWKLENGQLVKEFSFEDFMSAVGFVNHIGLLAEQANHHPDVLIYSYNTVRIMLVTHAKKRVTEKDYSLAKQIDALYVK